ncbi:MAG: HAD family hydrolase [Polyangiaceae bacterium]
MRFDLCVFDVAGTTLRDDEAVARCMRETIARRGPEPSPGAVADVMGLGKPVALGMLLRAALRREPRRTEIKAASDEFERRMIRHYTLATEVAPIPGANTVFQALRSFGVRVALDTGFSRRILNAVLHRVGWLEGAVVDFTVTSDEVPRGRPHPDMIHRAMHVLEVDDGHRVCKVGDTIADIREGRAAGCGLVVGVTSGTGTRDELARAGADLVLDSIADLPGLLARHHAA